MANPSRLEKIQITGNANSGTATKVNVQEANGEVNTQTINTGFNKNFGLNSGDVVGADNLLNQYGTTPIDWTATAYSSGQVVFYGGKQWIAISATLAGDIPASSLKWKETTFEAINNSLNGKISGSNYPDYVAQKAPASISSSTYQSFPLMLRSNYGKVLLFYRDGADHASSKGVVKMRISEDGGGNFGGETIIATDAIYDCRNVSGGVTPTGRIVLFYMRYNFTASTSFDQGFIYSDDDGSTWSNYQTIPSGTHTFFSPYGEMISIGNNKLMACWYGETPATPTYSTYIVTSSDNGLTWSSAVAVATSTTLRYGESSYAYLDGGIIVGHVRNSNGSPLYQVISTNNGATWTNQGVTTVDGGSQVSPMLATFIDPNNQKYIASFYANRTDNKLKVAVAEYATAVAGVSGWTRTDIDSHTSTDFGYPSFIKSKENNKFLIAYYKATSTTLASIYFKNYTPNYRDIAVTGTISSTGSVNSSADVSAKDLKSSNSLQIKGVLTGFPTDGNGLEAYNSTATESIIQSYNRILSIFNALNFRGSILLFSIGAVEAMRIHASKGVSIGNTTDPGTGNLSVTGNITASPAVSPNQVVVKSQLDAVASSAGTSGTWSSNCSSSDSKLTGITTKDSNYLKVGSIVNCSISGSFTGYTTSESYTDIQGVLPFNSTVIQPTYLGAAVIHIPTTDEVIQAFIYTFGANGFRLRFKTPTGASKTGVFSVTFQYR